MQEQQVPTGAIDPAVAPGPRPRLGYAAVTFAALCFALNGTVSKTILSTGIEAGRLTQLRTTSAFLLLVVVVAVTRPAALRVRRDEWRLLLVYGVVGITFTQLLYFVAISRMPVGVALLLEFTAPVLVALWCRFVRHAAVGRGLWAGLALALGGLALVGRVWEGLVFDVVGVLAGLAAACTLAAYFLLAETGVRHRDPVSLTMWGFGVSAVFWALVRPWWSFPWARLSGEGVIDGWQVPVMWLVVYMVVLGTVVPFALNIVAIPHLSATAVGIVGMSEPVLASAVAWSLLGESLAPVQALGGLVVLIGVGIAERSR